MANDFMGALLVALMSLVSLVIGAVGKLYLDNGVLREAEAKCRERAAVIEADVDRLFAEVQVLRGEAQKMATCAEANCPFRRRPA